VIEEKGVRELVRDHRFEHPGRHLPECSVEANDPGLATVAAPLGGLVGHETDLGDLGRVGKPCGHPACDLFGAAIRVDNVCAGSAHQLASQFEDRLVKFPNRNPVRGAHQQGPAVETRVDVLDPLPHDLQLEGHSVYFQRSRSIRHGQHAT